MGTMTVAESSDAVVPVGANRTFRRLLRASSVSMLGSHVTTIAYPLLVLRMTGSPFAAGWVAFAATAPSLLVHMPAGALVDRWDPRRAMLVSEIGRGIAIAAVAITLAMRKPSVPLLMAAAVIEGVLEVFSGLAERRCVGELLRRDQVSPALVRIEGRNHVVLLAGRPLGGLLFGIASILPFLADVVSFVYSATTLVRIKGSWPSAERAEVRWEAAHARHLGNDIKNGLRSVYKDRFAWSVMILFSVGTLIFQALIILFLAVAHAQRLSAFVIGMVLAASGAGGVLGSAVASRLFARVTYPWIRLQTLIWFLGFAVLALLAGRQVWLMAGIMAILGFTGALGNIALDTHLMKHADKDMLARVTSISRVMSLSACAIGPAFGGILVQELGVQGAMTCLFLISPVLLLLSVIASSAPEPAVSPQPAAKPPALRTVLSYRPVPSRSRRGDRGDHVQPGGAAGGPDAGQDAGERPEDQEQDQLQRRCREHAQSGAAG